MNGKKIFIFFTFCFSLFVFSACGTAKPAAKIVATASAGLTMAVVAQHNTPDDCWLVINNNIYNVTDYIPNHPGGEQTIVPYCGKDATTAFDSKEKNPSRPHSDMARQILEQYYIGSLSR
jgi:cytochrome b involved in lipid metabolism